MRSVSQETKGSCNNQNVLDKMCVYKGGEEYRDEMMQYSNKNTIQNNNQINLKRK